MKRRTDRHRQSEAGILVGIFAGGHSSRMGTSKALLLAPDQSGRNLLERLHDEVARVLPLSRCVVVGRRSEHTHLAFHQIEDAEPDCGPLGGLVALLELAEREGKRAVLAIACDYPSLSGDLVLRLATEYPEAGLLSPYLADRHQPLFARYSVQLLGPLRERLDGGELALMPFFRDRDTARLALTEEEKGQLADWDCPEDMRQKGP